MIVLCGVRHHPAEKTPLRAAQRVEVFAVDRENGGHTILASCVIGAEAPLNGESRCNRLTRVEEPDFARHWLDWLLEEVRSWKDSPHLVRLVMQILTNQNQPVGYRAETALRYGLIDRYSDVPLGGESKPRLISALKASHRRVDQVSHGRTG